jgi:hypothetical protein
MRRTRTGLGILACLALAATVGAQEPSTDLIDAVTAFLESNPSQFEVIDVPGIGEIPGSTALSEDFVLPDDLTFGDPPETTVPAGTLLVDFPVAAVQALTDDSQLEGLLTSVVTPPQEVDADPSYDIKVTGVDTRSFPDITLEFQVLPKDIESPTFSPAALRQANFEITETVLGELRPVSEIDGEPPVTLCSTASLVVGIAVDSSCSVQNVIGDLKAKALLFASEVLDPARARTPEDAISFYAFDGKGKFRTPSLAAATDGDPATPAYYSVTNQPATAYDEFAAVDVDRPCLGSPIFESMIEELGWLVDYRRGDNELRRVLVAFADFRDTEGRSAKRAMIDALEANGDVQVVGLGFGRVDKRKVKQVFGLDEETDSYRRGGFIQNGSEDVFKALRAVYDGLGYTYCLTYTTPFPNRFNEVVDVGIEFTEPGIGAVSRAKARYALPLVVPEDNDDVRVFLPLAYEQYEAATQDDGDNTTIVVRPRFIPDPEAVVGKGPPRDVPEELQAPGTAVVDHTDLGFGVWLRESELGEDWPALFEVPTEYVRVDPDDPGAPRLLDASRFELDVLIRTPASLGDGTPYKGTPIVTVQDRTPPHVFVRLAPSDGRRPHQLTVREDQADRDPMPLDSAVPVPADGRLDSAAVMPTGSGGKRARVDLRWVDTEGAEFDATLLDQRWSKFPDGGGPGQEVAAFQDAAGTPATQQVFVPDDYVDGGLRVGAGVRVEVTVLARDNYARLDEVDSTHPVDGAAFSAPDPTAPDGPVHARFDQNRPEAQGTVPEAPFLPVATIEELRADPTRAGVAWWIQSSDDRDRFANQPGIRTFQYPKDDIAVLADLAEEGVVVPPFPLRTFEVQAQDGQGNVTRTTIPLFVTPTGFDAQRIETQTGRGKGR